jgi:hypothetical protein
MAAMLKVDLVFLMRFDLLVGYKNSAGLSGGRSRRCAMQARSRRNANKVNDMVFGVEKL